MAEQLAARVTGWEFEIPDYKYNSMFTPLEELLRKPPQPPKKPPSAAKKTGAAAQSGTAEPVSK